MQLGRWKMNKAVIESLDYYLSLNKPEYAFMISGAWGVGKTYFMNNYLENRKGESEKIIRFSLFGLKNTNEIDTQFLCL